MFNILDYLRENLIKIIIILIIVLIGVFCYFNFNEEASLASDEIINEVSIAEVAVKEEVKKKLYVDIKGKVKKPGIYEMEEIGRASCRERV